MTSLSPFATARLLSNGHLRTVMTPSGAGFTGFDWFALNRWNPEAGQNGLGYFFYLRDLDTHEFWSATPRPVDANLETIPVEGSPGVFRIAAVFQGIESFLEVTVAADLHLELRRLRLRNMGAKLRRIEITSYLEVVLNHPAADEAHPAFSKLFVQTAYDEKNGALLAHRRPRSTGEIGQWIMHTAIGGEDAQFETDRLRFIGRGHRLEAPQALLPGARLSNTVGNVLDPVFALRRTVEIQPDAMMEVCFGFGIAHERDEALKLRQAMSTPKKVDGLFSKAEKTESQLQGDLGIAPDRAGYFELLGVAMLCGIPELRAPAEILAVGVASPEVFARHSLPAWGLHCVVMAFGRNDPKVSELIKVRRFWQHKGLEVSLIVFAEYDDWNMTGEPVFVRSAADMPRNDFNAILTSADWVIVDQFPEAATVASRLQSAQHQKRQKPSKVGPAKDISTSHLRFFNGYGGFSRDGNEYIVDLRDGETSKLKLPPAPWINTVANETIGFLISESGAGYTWSRNSREHRLTHWSNDPVLDPHSEALYVRDDETGEYWSPTPGPVPAGNDYQTCHGFGYTRFIHQSHGLSQETTLFVPRKDPIKIACIRLTNNTETPRRLSLFSHVELLLGNSPKDHGRHVTTAFDAKANVLTATSQRADAFADGIVFASGLADGRYKLYVSGDKTGFLGASADISRPEALHQPYLDGVVGVRLHPAASLQLEIQLPPLHETTCIFLLGETTDWRSLTALIERYRSPTAIAQALAEVRQFWNETMDAVQIQTPSPAIDLMVNGWLLYQNLACRIWGRSAFYQSGGAYGYRDQLQDSSALVCCHPDFTRQQILLHSAHQFVEGDVLHWWHPTPLETGLRTRFSDDLVWLPYITAHYVATTGDTGILDEIAPFVTARELEPGEDENYLKPTDSGRSGTVYEHCCRALDRSLLTGTGAHGLPLMGTGDWNDGMSRVGREGRGESVWMAFFLVRTLTDFLPICELRGDGQRMNWYREVVEQLKVAINDQTWDGEWYRRAFYDNGAVMGSKDSDECQIDALAQAWAVISQCASEERAQSALDALERRLVMDDPGIIKLLTPAFVDTPNDPGYIKGYVAGVRENGGQYTHAACWVIRALAESGRTDRAVELLEKIGPIHHTRNQASADTYKVEPYVVAADIYGEAPHVGRGGWTWYTGSAGWMYRVAVESILGIRYEKAHTLVIAPAIPSSWPEFQVSLRLLGDATRYEICVKNPHQYKGNVKKLKVDGADGNVVEGTARIPLVRDGSTHRVQLTLGPKD